MKYNLIITVLLFSVFVSCVSNGEKTEVETHKFTNELINETSPYLLQHAHNPVNWMPWGDAAFEKAKAEKKLVLVSIGYSSCHWCHVMEKESFENEEIAAIMNKNFICVKVDREERPDVDQVYMNAVELMTGGGGWPLNCFTLPDGKPIQGGTYYQPEQWIELLNNLAYKYEKSPKEVERFAENLTKGIQQDELVTVPKVGIQFSQVTLDSLVNNWKPFLDTTEGGNLQEIKFPLPNNLEFMQQYAYHDKDSALMKHVDLTLKKMALGGIYDQIGGGFARYSTDARWKVPHFEKMLYDNAQLISLYSHAYKRTKDPLYKQVVYQTLGWAQREMMTPSGAFYSALDADSEGEEGKFYVWTKEELQKVLDPTEYKLAEEFYSVGIKGLWEENYILLRGMDNVAYAQSKGMDLKSLNQQIKTINKKLLAARNNRIRPGLDDKSLTSWNAMMIVGLLDAYQVFGEPLFLKGALMNSQWIEKSQLSKDGKLLHTFKNGQAKINGFLEDYCFTIEAYIKLYEVTFDEKHLKKADQMAQYAITHFYDQQSGMFYFSSDQEGSLIARKMEILDNVIPSSNSMMATVLYDLGILLSKEDYREKSKQLLANVYNDMAEQGTGYTNWGILALNMLNPYFEIAITGKEWQKTLKDWHSHYIPNALYMGGATSSSLEVLDGKFTNETMIYVCLEGACKRPTTTVRDALSIMK